MRYINLRYLLTYLHAVFEELSVWYGLSFVKLWHDLYNNNNINNGAAGWKSVVISINCQFKKLISAGPGHY